MFSKTDIKCICWQTKDFDDIKMHGAAIKKDKGMLLTVRNIRDM